MEYHWILCFIFVYYCCYTGCYPECFRKGAKRKREILDMLAENPAMTQTGLLEELKLTRKQVQNDMKELQKEGLLSREGSNRSGKWIVKKD